MSSPALLPPSQSVSNPLNKPVDLICKNAEYLTRDLVQRLLDAMPEELTPKNAPGTMKDETMSDSLNSLMTQLQSMMRLHERLMRSASQSDDPDAARKALSSGKDLFNLFAKFEEQIDRQSRQKNIEMAVRETFEEMENPELKKKFLSKLREKLVGSAQIR